MSTDEIQNLTLTTERALKMVACEVRNEIEIVKSESWSYIKQEKEAILGKLDEKITIGIEEASILVSLSRYISLLEAEKVKYFMQIERLQQENDWLNEEEKRCEEKLSVVREALAELIDDRDVSRAAFVLRKSNPDSCDRIVTEFSKIMTTTADNQDEALSPEYENFFSSKVQAMYYLSIQCVKHSEFGLARMLVNRMLEKITSAEGATSPDVASLYEILAMISRREGKLEESLPYLQRSLQIREFCFGKDSVQVSITLNNLSICQSKMSSFKEAMESCSRALAIKENVHGSNSPIVAKQLHNLALVCTYLSNFSDAQRYFQRAIDIHKSMKPFDEEKLLKTQNSIAMCYLRQNKISEAQPIIYALIDRYHERILHRHPSKANDPSIYMITDMYADNKRKAIKLLTEVYGLASINELTLVGKNLSTLYRKLKQEKKMEIIQEWLTMKSKPRSLKKEKTSDKRDTKSDISKKNAISDNSISEAMTESSMHTSDAKSTNSGFSRGNLNSSTCTFDESNGSKTNESKKSIKLKNPLSYIFKKKL